MSSCGACSVRRPARSTNSIRLSGPALALLLAAAACGDDGAGPSDDVDFPFLEAAVRAEFCIRGQMVPPDAENEALQNSDCETVFPVGQGPDRFYETWRVRVPSRTTVTIFTESNLDTFLDVFRIDPANPALRLENLVQFNNDGPDGPDAGLTVTLDPGLEYWVMVSGFGADEFGPYTLRATD